ncbi:MAG TPA: DUF4920 domain-containing protein [Bacteroidia bacterium]|nr:DUF4920 domain-containing protein [Bacteroidia bacterium]
MKSSNLIIAVLFCALSFSAQPPKGKATPGTVYGAKTTEQGAVSMNEVQSLLKSKDTVAVKVKAQVVSSCAKKGCWMNLKIDDNSTAFVKMKDYAFFVPTDIENKTVVLDGIAFIEETSVEELQHYAKDAKKPQTEIDAIKEPKRQVRFLANGILVL